MSSHFETLSTIISARGRKRELPEGSWSVSVNGQNDQGTRGFQKKLLPPGDVSSIGKESEKKRMLPKPEKESGKKRNRSALSVLSRY